MNGRRLLAQATRQDERIEREVRRGERLGAIRRARGFFGPVMAMESSSVAHLDGNSAGGFGQVASARTERAEPTEDHGREQTETDRERVGEGKELGENAAPTVGDERGSELDGEAPGRFGRSAGRSLAAEDRAATLLAELDAAVTRNDDRATARIVDEAQQVLKELDRDGRENAERSDDVRGADDARSAFAEVVSSETGLDAARRAAEREEAGLPSHLHGTVQGYEWSSGHDAMVVVVGHDDERRRYPADAFAQRPTTGNRVTMHWGGGRGTFDDYGRPATDRARLGERTMGSA